MGAYRLVHFINFSRKLTVNAVFFLVPLYFLKIGFTGWQIGLAASLYAFAPLVFSFPTGWLNDRLSIKEVVRFGLAATSLAFFLVSRVRHFLPIALVFLLIGTANNALDVSLNSLYFKTESGQDLNRKYSQLAFWQALGAAVGTLLAGIVVVLTSFKTLFLVFAVFLLILQVFARGLPQAPFEAVPMKVYRSNILSKKAILFSIMIFVVGLHWGVEGTVYSPFLKQYFSLTLTSLSLYISLALFGLAFSSFFIGLIRHDSRVNKRIFLFSMLFSGAGLILMVNPSLALSFLFRIVHEVGDGLLGALIWLFISRLFERASIGGSAAVLLMVMTLGHMVGSLLFASIGFRYGLIYPFYIGGLLLVLNAVFGMYVFRQADF